MHVRKQAYTHKLINGLQVPDIYTLLLSILYTHKIKFL